MSSIKRIIAEEGETAAAPRVRRGARLPVPPQNDEIEEADEVLELSDPMPSAVAPRTEPTPPKPDPVAAKPEQIMPKPRAEPVPPLVVDDEVEAEPIVSTHTQQAARGALDSLSKLLVKPEPSGDGTLEGLVREMLRPMLREWLDANLPAMVEVMVAREIAKITQAQ